MWYKMEDSECMSLCCQNGSIVRGMMVPAPRYQVHLYKHMPIRNNFLERERIKTRLLFLENTRTTSHIAKETNHTS